MQKISLDSISAQDFQNGQINQFDELILDQIAIIEKELFFDAWDKKSLVDTLCQFGSRLITAKVADELVGYCVFNHIFEVAEILRIAVCQRHQKKSIAGQLLTQSCQIAKDHQAEKMLLEVRADNIPAINLYKKMGFYQINIRKNYYRYQNNQIDAVIFQKDL